MAITPKGDTFSYVASDGSVDEARMVSWFPASTLATEGPDGYPRLRVDNGNTAFFAGREFRFFYEFSTEAGNAITGGNSRWIKIVLPVNCILRNEQLNLDVGAVRYRSWRNAVGQESGSPAFVAPASPTGGLFSRNPAAQAQSGYTGQASVLIGNNGAVNLTGGQVVGGTVSGVARIRVANASGQATTAGGEATLERGVPAGTYHVQLQSIGSSAAEGTYNFAFEERTGV